MFRCFCQYPRHSVQKKAKAKLPKGAKRKNLNVEVRPGCVNLRFNDGAYFQIVLPLLREWKQKSQENQFLFKLILTQFSFLRRSPCVGRRRCTVAKDKGDALCSLKHVVSERLW